MSMVLQFFFIRFANLSFYTKHMFKFIYVNQLIHMVILVDNVDKFVHNLIIGGFSDFCHVENFLQSFSLIHHSSTGFVHIARTTFRADIARIRTHLSNVANPLRCLYQAFLFAAFYDVSPACSLDIISVFLLR